MQLSHVLKIRILESSIESLHKAADDMNLATDSVSLKGDNATEEGIGIELEATDLEVEATVAHLTTGDFHSKWDRVKRFSQRFEHWGDRPIPYLIKHLHSQQDPENQWFLIRALSYFNHPQVVEALAAFLVSTPLEELQSETVKALTGFGNSAIATLAQLIQQPAIEQRILAARTLSKIRRTAVIEPLLSVASDPDEQLRSIAIEALGSFHDERITPILFKALNDEGAIAIEAIRTLGRRSDLLATTDLMARLDSCLHHSNPTVARESAIALGRLGSHPQGEAAALILGTFITQPAPSATKIPVVRALSWLDSSAATLHLANAFDCPFPLITPEVKQEIARSLGQTQSDTLKPTAAKPLAAWLNTDSAAKTSTGDIGLKQATISALARLGATDAVESLIDLLADPDDRIRMHALSALKQIDPEVSPSRVKRQLSVAMRSPELSEKITNSLSAW